MLFRSRDLPCGGERFRLARAAEVLDRHIEEFGRDAHDGRCGDLRRVRIRDEVPQHDLREPDVDRLLVQRSERGDADSDTPLIRPQLEYNSGLVNVRSG